MPTILFYLFALIMIGGGIGVVALKNPVSSALSMIVSFIGLAALFVGLNAYFVGILQILVYTGAVMVLFLFIIMLLDLKKEEEKQFSSSSIAAGVVIPTLLVLQLIAVFQTSDFGNFQAITPESLAMSEQQLDPSIPADSVIRSSMAAENLADRKLPDVNLIGHKLFNEYNLPLQIIAVLLLVATVGCVALSKKLKAKS
ncbi:NADH-quinone oxidoreductase subunit J family protein [Rubritalea marina]|uniref:NADH-quinone oxidoreductase subunit J family protein n=1 Tax=Rubritalea marina TaxID=361055 RepID=UPI0003729869|nr:NADH-quinone oxidoreductase subunit J [Rubritalea marina]